MLIVQIEQSIPILKDGKEVDLFLFGNLESWELGNNSLNLPNVSYYPVKWEAIHDYDGNGVGDGQARKFTNNTNSFRITSFGVFMHPMNVASDNIGCLSPTCNPILLADGDIGAGKSANDLSDFYLEDGKTENYDPKRYKETKEAAGLIRKIYEENISNAPEGFFVKPRSKAKDSYIPPSRDKIKFTPTNENTDNNLH